MRHRLEKKDPSAAVSEAVKPIVYYVDNGAPEPIRSALVEGASWWAQAFEAAGFKNGFQVKVLPADADPMDVRYNVINWVHRSTRGWSYGNSIVDPRTGEILKGHVTLGSLRVRQDYMLGTGMIPTYTGGASARGGRRRPERGVRSGLPSGSGLPRRRGRAAATTATRRASSARTLRRPNDPSYGMSIQRIRQLSAHEVGHTLGFAHNFAASTYGGRASVMDYPAPLVEIKNGALDLSNAYTNVIGAYDTWSVKFAYSQFAPRSARWSVSRGGDESAQLEQIVQEGVKAGMHYITDQDARPAGAVASAREPLGQRQRPDRDAEARNGSAADRAVEVRVEERAGGLAAVAAGSEAAAVVSASPLSVAGGGEVGGRRVLLVCGARGQRTEPVTGAADRAGRRAARGARCRARRRSRRKRSICRTQSSR